MNKLPDRSFEYPVKQIGVEKICPECRQKKDLAYFGMRYNKKRKTYIPQSLCTRCRSRQLGRKVRYITLRVPEDLSKVTPAIIGRKGDIEILTFKDREIKISSKLFDKFVQNLKQGHFYTIKKLTREEHLALLRNLLPQLYFRGFYVGDFSQSEMARWMGETNKRLLEYSKKNEKNN